MKYVQFGSQHPKTILLLHGGGLSWWNYREAAQLLQTQYRVILPILDGHADSGFPFGSIEENAARIICHIDQHFGGRILALGGLSLGGQIAVEILSQRPDICEYALIESAMVKPMGLTHALIAPVFGMSYGLIGQRWFAKMQAAYLGIPKALFEDYDRDTRKITKRDMIAFLQSSSAYSLKADLADTQAKVMIVVGGREQPAMLASGRLLKNRIPNSDLEILPGYRHGELSLSHPGQYVKCLTDLLVDDREPNKTEGNAAAIP